MSGSGKDPKPLREPIIKAAKPEPAGPVLMPTVRPAMTRKPEPAGWFGAAVKRPGNSRQPADKKGH
jgi:hypothetical protein